MHDRSQSSRSFWYSLGTGGSLIALAVAGACSIDSGTSEIDNYELAVSSRSVEGARAFISDFRTSHLVGDLIQSLPPDVALEICTDLPIGAPSQARASCRQLRETATAEPIAPSEPAQIAAMPLAAGPSLAASGCNGTVLNVAPSANEPKVVIEPRAPVAATRQASDQKRRPNLPAARDSASVAAPRMQVATLPASRSAVSTRLDEEFNGRGGKAGDAGGRNARN